MTESAKLLDAAILEQMNRLEEVIKTGGEDMMGTMIESQHLILGVLRLLFLLTQTTATDDL